jgi:hypothetical protein
MTTTKFRGRREKFHSVHQLEALSYFYVAKEEHFQELSATFIETVE